jgi:hypothetical protein
LGRIDAIAHLVLSAANEVPAAPAEPAKAAAVTTSRVG